MAEVACHQVGHEDDVSGLAINFGVGPGCLDWLVYGLDRAIAQCAIDAEAVEDAVSVSLQGQSEPLS